MFEKLRSLFTKKQKLKLSNAEARDYFFTKMRNTGMQDYEIEGWWGIFLLTHSDYGE
jgi:hypothetical protein